MRLTEYDGSLKGEFKLLIVAVIVAIVLWQGIGYSMQLANYNSIPIYDKACGLNYTQTWDNAYKFFWIDTDPCNINNVEHNK